MLLRAGLSLRSFGALGLMICTLAVPQTAWCANGLHWISTWSAAPDQAGPPLKAHTIRQIVRSSVGGARVRIRLSNLYGKEPVPFGSVHVGLHASGSAIVAGSDRALSFGGKAAVTLNSGESILSDPVDMAVMPLQQLAVSMYLPHGAGSSTLHGTAMQTAYLTQAGDATGNTTFPIGTTDDSRYFLTDVEVGAAPGGRSLVIVGDSITDGIGSTDDRNSRWPDVLAERLQGVPSLASVAVVNAGISGNRILNDAAAPFVGASMLARLDRDALSKPGVRWILLHAGINDITAAGMLPSAIDQVSAAQIIAGMKTLIAAAHAKGIKVWGATLLPRGGSGGKRAHTPAAELMRLAVNDWIRGAGNFDAVIDFEQAMRMAEHPDRLQPTFDSGDHTHPNDAGYRAMAAAIDLRLFSDQ
jgi:lysophospholipase L1-like esterase